MVAVSNKETVATNRILQAGVIATIAAVIANIVVYFITTGLIALPVEFSFPPGSPIQPLELIMVILSTAFGAVGATIVLALLARFVSRPVTIFYVVSIIVLILSLGAPLSLNASGTTTAVLFVMHIVAAVIIVGALVRFTRPA